MIAIKLVIMDGLFLYIFLILLLSWISCLILIAWGISHPPRVGIANALDQGFCVDPEKHNLNIKSFHCDLSDGTRLVGWRCSKKGSRGQEAPKIILHGWSSSRWFYVEELALRAELHEEVIIFDQRGCGESGGSCTMGRLEPNDLKELLEHLKINKISLEGWSAGASCATRYLKFVDQSVEVTNLDLVAPFISGSETLKSKLNQQGIFLGFVVNTFHPFLNILGLLPLGLSLNINSYKGKIRVLVGENDTLIQHQKLKMWCKKFGASLSIVPKAGHVDTEVRSASNHFFSSV